MIKMIRVNEKLQVKQNWASIKEAAIDTGIYDLGSRTRTGEIIYCPDSDTYIMRFEDYGLLKMWVERITPEVIRNMKNAYTHMPKCDIKVTEEDNDFWDSIEDCCKSR